MLLGQRVAQRQRRARKQQRQRMGKDSNKGQRNPQQDHVSLEHLFAPGSGDSGTGICVHDRLCGLTSIDLLACGSRLVAPGGEGACSSLAILAGSRVSHTKMFPKNYSTLSPITSSPMRDLPAVHKPSFPSIRSGNLPPLSKGAISQSHESFIKS